MNALERHIAEIKRLKEEKSKSKSRYLISDYNKKIKEMITDLREYCKIRNLDFNEVANGLI
jgi:hypothetical protein